MKKERPDSGHENGETAMNAKEVSELRRRLRPEKNNISHICGCYVNDKREVITLFCESLSRMPQEEAERFLGLFKKSMGGTLGKNLIDIVFSTAQVMDSDEHRLLTALRNSALQDSGAVETFYQRVIDAVDLTGQYVILLACDAYDVPYRGGDGARQDDASDQVFRYVLCSICPVKEAPPALCYAPQSNAFHASELARVVAAPELGFLFPAFDDRAANIYNALYYTKDTSQSHPSFVDAIFRTPLPLPAAVQKQTFQAVLGETLSDACSLEVVQSVQEQLCEKLEQHKLEKDPEPLTVSMGEMRRILDDCGVAPERLQAFEEKYDEAFGKGADVSARNLVDTARMEVRTPDVVIQVSPERSDLIETRVIDGTRYILICAEEGVEVNGVPVHISEGPQR